MNSAKQAKLSKPEAFRFAVKEALFDRGETITEMAKNLYSQKTGRNFARHTVSLAINHYRFPKVIRAIRDYLHL